MYEHYKGKFEKFSKTPGYPRFKNFHFSCIFHAPSYHLQKNFSKIAFPNFPGLSLLTPKLFTHGKMPTEKKTKTKKIKKVASEVMGAFVSEHLRENGHER